MRFIFGALAAVMLFVGTAVSQTADARCFWDGFGWRCWHPAWVAAPYAYWHPHPYWGPRWGWYHGHHHHWG